MSHSVIDLARSPKAVLKPVPLDAVRLEDSFWSPRLQINREVTISSQLRHCEETGRIDNFRRASGKKEGAFQGLFFNDSDVYKWLEAAAYSLATHPDPKLEADVEGVIQEIADAQQADGYLNTYFMFEREAERFTNLKDMHEIYCAGHLMQAAVAHHRATGKHTLLDVACRLADHLYAVFGPGGRPGACGHEEAEMGLVELYRTTGAARYLELAERMIAVRGQKPPVLGGSAYHQDHLPFTEQTEMIGHAVRHLYLCCGAADVALEKEVPEVSAALETLWSRFVREQMYVTGGAGARYEGEAFGAPFELPNDRAYTETCAAIGSFMWNWRMLHLTGEARFADLMERTLYNAILPGLSLEGKRYFYQNPLADRGKHRRQEWFGCACCPPNVARLLASLPGYFSSTAEANEERSQTVYLHLYAASTATIPLPDGGTVILSVKTDYPWDGGIEIRFEAVPSTPFELALRVPGWYGVTPSRQDPPALEINGRVLSPALEGEGSESHLHCGYVRLRKQSWQAGDMVRVNWPMEVQRVYCDPRVGSNYGRVALQRGPLIYCLEQADHGETDLWEIALHPDAELTPEFVPELLGGVTVLRGRSVRLSTAPQLYLSRPATAATPLLRQDITAIPYYAWANRAPGPMQVWLPVL